MTTLSNFLGEIANQTSPEKLEGAIVLVSLERTLDELIQKALALGPYHRGTASPWSHTFLLTQPYSGPGTQICECSIRNNNNEIIWDGDPAGDPLNIVLAQHVESGICVGTVADYDDDRVINKGVKFLPDISGVQRKALSASALAMQNGQIKYDLPGLFREAIRLTIGIRLPPSPHLLFCSAFVQKIYRQVLGADGDFVPTLADEDTTPDDLWYPVKGTKFQA